MERSLLVPGSAVRGRSRSAPDNPDSGVLESMRGDSQRIRKAVEIGRRPSESSIVNAPNPGNAETEGELSLDEPTFEITIGTGPGSPPDCPSRLLAGRELPAIWLLAATPTASGRRTTSTCCSRCGTTPASPPRQAISGPNQNSTLTRTLSGIYFRTLRKLGGATLDNNFSSHLKALRPRSLSGVCRRLSPHPGVEGAIVSGSPFSVMPEEQYKQLIVTRKERIDG